MKFIIYFKYSNIQSYYVNEVLLMRNHFQFNFSNESSMFYCVDENKKQKIYIT